MATLYYVDEDNSIKAIANTNSPYFVGEPCTNNRNVLNDRDILNVEDAVNYIDTELEEFNRTRFVYANTNRLTGLVKGKKYAVSVYGKFNTGNSDTYSVGPVVLRSSSNNILKSSGVMINNLVNPKCMISQNATLILDEAPDDGVVNGFVNYNTDSGSGTDATYMVAIRLS